jgi:hypothetical protein
MAVGGVGAFLGSPASASNNIPVKADAALQAAQGSKKPAQSAQTDTVTISAQALKMADDKSAVAKQEAKKADDQKALQLASDKAAAAKKTTQASQDNAIRAYAAVGATR